MFEAILIGAIVIIVACLIIGMIAILRDKDELNRAVLADYIFYGAVCLYFVWTIFNDTFIGYEIAILAALVCGTIPTLSMSRIISRGRR
ncbi:cation:proton antiporter [Corynebacterium meitnerae]|uniref:Cation:proton antiporter n=1 Tax=Corynebacterium meitnerae TaxID=2913498 RepID=A0A9X3LUR7_9CORY|nr:cation:proton antiporter [Corynebacterium meitnerae]MCZ9294596.1 cation:proton antiporter [Corynebacterium meitnerae]